MREELYIDGVYGLEGSCTDSGFGEYFGMLTPDFRDENGYLNGPAFWLEIDHNKETSRLYRETWKHGWPCEQSEVVSLERVITPGDLEGVLRKYGLLRDPLESPYLKVGGYVPKKKAL